MKSAALFAALLCAAPAVAGNVDCRTCHLYVDPANPAPDFSEYFDNISRQHHATGVPYPQQFGFNAEYNQPTGMLPEIQFFDTNFDGQPDPNEVQLFGTLLGVTVECASCHIEHGTAPLVPAASPALGVLEAPARNTYLRLDNANSALCTVCHKY